MHPRITPYPGDSSFSCFRRQCWGLCCFQSSHALEAALPQARANPDVPHSIRVGIMASGESPGAGLFELMGFYSGQKRDAMAGRRQGCDWSLAWPPQVRKTSSASSSATPTAMSPWRGHGCSKWGRWSLSDAVVLRTLRGGIQWLFSWWKRPGTFHPLLGPLADTQTRTSFEWRRPVPGSVRVWARVCPRGQYF